MPWIPSQFSVEVTKVQWLSITQKNWYLSKSMQLLGTSIFSPPSSCNISPVTVYLLKLPTS
jgi:hypothetical protein